MANLVSRATGNWTAAGTWEVGATGTNAVQSAITNTSSTVTSYTWSPAFTITNNEVLTGLLIFCNNRSAAGVTPTGTFTVALSDDNGVTATREVTVDVADLAAAGGWTFFQFGSTLTADGGADYKVGVKSSVDLQVSVWRSSTTAAWARIPTTNVTQAPTAGDATYVVGEHTGQGAYSTFTVTMNNTDTTEYGAVTVGCRGTLTYDTTQSTTLRLAGSLTVQGPTATLNIGTSGSPIPRAYTAVLEFVCGSNGQYRLFNTNEGNINAYGESRTSGKAVVQCRMSAACTAGATTISVDTDTGWLDGDEIVVAPSYRTATEYDRRTLSGNAGASSITVTAGTTYAHEGTSPVQAEVIHLTRNVKIRSTSATFHTSYVPDGSSHTDMQWVEFRYCGYSSNAAVDGRNLASAVSASLVMRYCSVYDGNGNGISLVTTGLFPELRDLVLHNYGITYASAVGVTGSGIWERVWVIGPRNTGFQPTSGITINDCVAAALGTGLSFNGTINSSTIAASSNCTFHSCSSAGVTLTGVTGASSGRLAITGWRVYRCASLASVDIDSCTRIDLVNWDIFGCGTNNLVVSDCSHVRFRGCTINGETPTFTTATGVQSAGTSNWAVSFENCDIGVAGGALGSGSTRATHGTQDILRGGTGFHQLFLENCRLGSTTEVGGWLNTSGPLFGSGLFITGKDQVFGADFAYLPMQGLRVRNTSIVVSGEAWSEELQFSALAKNYPFASGIRTLPVQASTAGVVSVPVRKSSAYNGSAPVLVVLPNPVGGIDEETVLDTLSVGADEWETLSGQTMAVDQDCILEFLVSGAATAGSIYISQSWNTP